MSGKQAVFKAAHSQLLTHSIHTAHIICIHKLAMQRLGNCSANFPQNAAFTTRQFSLKLLLVHSVCATAQWWYYICCTNQSIVLPLRNEHCPIYVYLQAAHTVRLKQQLCILMAVSRLHISEVAQ